MFDRVATALGVETWVLGFVGIGAFLLAVGVYHWRNPHRFGGRKARRIHRSEEDMSKFWRLLAKTAAAVEIMLGFGIMLVGVRAVLA